MKRRAAQILLALFLALCFQGVQAQDNALVVANRKTKQFRHIRMDRWIVIKLKGGTKYHSWFMKSINDTSIVMAHDHVIRFDEINNLREITEMHQVLRFVGPIFFIPFGIVIYSVGLKDGKDASTGRQISSYGLSGVMALAALAPWVIKPKEYDFNTDWYLSAGTMPKKLFKRNIKQPKGEG